LLWIVYCTHMLHYPKHTIHPSIKEVEDERKEERRRSRRRRRRRRRRRKRIQMTMKIDRNWEMSGVERRRNQLTIG